MKGPRLVAFGHVRVCDGTITRGGPFFSRDFRFRSAWVCFRAAAFDTGAVAAGTVLGVAACLRFLAFLSRCLLNFLAFSLVLGDASSATS